ncbi:hypothetical protein PPYR_08725 [Photinus pyralis]|uniref:Uncharacterized protein n=1 Tax=Photinus pyralis TaxID=7054 RepID=A0A1Y1KXK7_PHOPY|nr:neprilysin-2-like [Photinus pyralis]KAB0797732.1 hypothetical protein PPYR_08725 [Photinus pyralis]
MSPSKKSPLRIEWLERKSNSERHLILLTAIVCVVAVALAIALGVVVCKMKSDADDVCLTPGCIAAAATAMSYMDTTQDPCDDFYEFACGHFIKETIIPADKFSVSTFSQLSEVVRSQLQLIITSEVEANASRPFKLLKKFYDICMNTTAIEQDGLKTIKRALKDLGGWPVLEGPLWNEGAFDWKLSTYKFRKFGFSTSAFLSFYVTSDDKNSSKNAITIDEASLGLSREYLVKGLEDKIVKAYYEVLVDIAVIFGADRASAVREIKEVVEFQIKLANICLPREKRRNATALYNIMTVEELQHDFPFLNWMEYLQNVFDVPGIEIPYDEPIIVTVPKYFPELENLLGKTPKRVLSNYMMSKIVLPSTHFLTAQLRDRMTEYHKVLSGQLERPQRWKECTAFASGSVYLISSALYVKKYFAEKSKMHAEEMVSDILVEFKKILKSVDWMDDVTRENALAKADSITTHIGYPDELLDTKKIDKFYMMLDDSSDNYLLTGKAIGLFFLEYRLKQLREPVNKTLWIDHARAAVVNAFYSASENSIQFPAGILQGIFFSDSRPNYLNYGGIGYVIGHEITHGFDDEGRQYDKDGNLNGWWGASTQEAFLKKAQCIIDQYANYSVLDQNLNGVNTQGENIADCGGVIEAYLAYMSWVERNGPEKKLPGLPYTPNQMFWVSAAHSWCSVETKEFLKMQVTTGVHSPDRIRVLIPFKNSEYFAKDFNCPLGSNMNPAHKCKVW